MEMTVKSCHPRAKSTSGSFLPIGQQTLTTKNKYLVRIPAPTPTKENFEQTNIIKMQKVLASYLVVL